jgi:hypothetical protein
MLYYHRQNKIVIEESMTGKAVSPRYAFVAQETYHIPLSSITIIVYVKEIFEKWRQVVSKNQKYNTSQVKPQEGVRLNRRDEKSSLPPSSALDIFSPYHVQPWGAS